MWLKTRAIRLSDTTATNHEQKESYLNHFLAHSVAFTLTLLFLNTFDIVKLLLMVFCERESDVYFATETERTDG